MTAIQQSYYPFGQTAVFNKVIKLAKKRDRKHIVLQGGTSSSKTYSILQCLACLMQETYYKRGIVVCSNNLAKLKTGAIDDFEEIISNEFFSSITCINRSDHVYKSSITGTKLKFSSFADKGEAKQAGKVDILFANEINEMSFDTIEALVIRTYELCFYDFNSDKSFWMHDEINLYPEKYHFFISNYTHNQFLPADKVAEIEDYYRRWKATGKEYWKNKWKVYGEGKTGVAQGLVYEDWKTIDDDVFHNLNEDIKVYGGDYGWAVPSALIELKVKDKDLYIHQLIYKAKLTPKDIANECDNLEVDKIDEMFIDSAAGELIETLSRSGYNAKKSNKSVIEGIATVQTFENVYVTKSSKGVIHEKNNYEYATDKDGNELDRPLKGNDHAMDAIRYGCNTGLAEYIQGFKASNGNYYTAFNKQTHVKQISFNKSLQTILWFRLGYSFGHYAMVSQIDGDKIYHIEEFKTDKSEFDELVSMIKANYNPSDFNDISFYKPERDRMAIKYARELNKELIKQGFSKLHRSPAMLNVRQPLIKQIINEYYSKNLVLINDSCINFIKDKMSCKLDKDTGKKRDEKLGIGIWTDIEDGLFRKYKIKKG